MRDMLITSSVLILAILLIRQLLKGKVNPKVQYALWLLVVWKLVVPVAFGNSPVSVLNLLPEKLLYSEVKDNAESIEAMKDEKYTSYIEQLQQTQNAETISDVETIPVDETVERELPAFWGNDTTSAGETDKTFRVAGKTTGVCIWLAGMVVVGGYMLFYQMKWKRFLRASRKPLKKQKIYQGISVYTVKGLPSPCLSGRSIYLTKEMATEERTLSHILAHEYCHYKQGDSVWVIVRCVLTAVYWFHPLVWVAAYVSKQDSELACDEAAIRLLGEEERFPYGRTLLQLIQKAPYERSRIGIASTMSGKEKGIRERISRIAGKNRYVAVAAGIVAVLALILVAACFFGAEKARVEQKSAVTEKEERIEENKPDSYDTELATGDYTDVRKPPDYVQSYYEQGEEVLDENFSIYESDEKGEPRTFVWQQLVKNTSDSEIWRLYLCVCYDTGTTELKEFYPEDYTKQIQERVSFSIAQDEKRVYVYDKAPGMDVETLVGTIDFSFVESGGRRVEEVFWDSDSIRFNLGEEEGELKLITGIGLKYEGVEEPWYYHLNLISFPVMCGNFGERTFTLGKVQVETEYVCGKMQDSSYLQEKQPDVDYYENSLSDEDTLAEPFTIEDTGDTAHYDVEVTYANPCPSYSRISDTFGSRIYVLTGEEVAHNGIDLAAEKGADIVAAAEGTIFKVGKDTKNGNYVVLYHSLNGTFTYYTHCQEILVAEGEQVARKQKIATVGQTGTATGPLLHFAVSYEGKWYPPEFE
ncbi:MAG: M56 family metallopeptidase [Lachnospiraceae bacterium]|nr:M56 family metallopeptidase [Lachnospiraceae bacterium]